MESVETINTTLQSFLSVCQVLLCYVIPLLLVIITALSFTKLYSKWEIAIQGTRDGVVKAVTAFLNGIASFFGLLVKKYAKWVLLAITITYIVCVILYFVFR